MTIAKRLAQLTLLLEDDIRCGSECPSLPKLTLQDLRDIPTKHPTQHEHTGKS